jgi:hypothetical protein
VRDDFWTPLENRRKYFDWFAEQHQFVTFEDWFSINLAKVVHVLHHIHPNQSHSRNLDLWMHPDSSKIWMVCTQSIARCLSRCAIALNRFKHSSEFIWHPWLFDSCPKGYWDDKSTHKQYLEWLAGRCC